MTSRRFTRALVGSILLSVATVGLIGCPRPPARSSASRTELGRAAALHARDPAKAATVYAGIGAVPGLEAIRERLWLDALQGSRSEASLWRAYLAARPSKWAARSAELELARALIREGRVGDAVPVLTSAMRSGSPEAGELLAEHGPRDRREAARRWLAVRAPGRLGSPAESAVVGSLTVEEKLERARSLMRSGRRSAALTELRRWSARGQAESERRRLAATAALDTGRPATALKLLPSGRRAGSRDHLLRARAWRARAWDRFPRSSANGAFVQAFREARQAAADGIIEADAQRVILEAAVETGRLDAAWGSWRRLAALGWDGARRGWLGRRLGVALARVGDGERVRALERELPEHRRCLAYWRGTLGGDRRGLDRLAAEPIVDLYGVWAAEDDGRSPPAFGPASPLGAGFVPSLVDEVLTWGMPDEARRVWWAAVESRGTDRREAAALAAFEARRDHPMAAVVALRRGFPELSTGRLDRLPRDVLERYLPLRWRREIGAAARESGVDPWLLAALARQESVFVRDARSGRGAVGLLQLLPSTAGRLAPRLGLGGSPDLTDPAVNLRLGAAEMARLQADFGALEYALAAYNAGPTRVRRWRRRWTDPRVFTEAIPIPETYWYVRRVVFLQWAYRCLYPDAW